MNMKKINLVAGIGPALAVLFVLLGFSSVMSEQVSVPGFRAAPLCHYMSAANVGIWGQSKSNRGQKMSQIKLYAVKTGTWGGRGVQMVVEQKAVKFQYDCGEGEIREPLKIDKKGKFKVKGFYKRFPFGPTLMNNEPKFVPVMYEGTITGGVLRYKITLIDTGEVIGDYTAERGRAARITRCA